MVYLPTGDLDLLLILGCMNSNFLVLELFFLYCSSLWRTETIVFAKLNKPQVSIKHSNQIWLEINRPLGVHNRGLTR